MKKLFVAALLFPFNVSAHPGIGIVKNSKGDIYYTDLQQVWKMTNGRQTIAVPHVHTHELYIDKNDNLYGEDLQYAGEGTNEYYHYLWILKPDGNLDTLAGPMQAYIQHEYSLTRDTNGNEYYIQQTDSKRIFKKSPSGKEVVFATGNFKNINWLHPQRNGSILFIQNNTVYRIDSGGRQTIIAKGIAGKNPTFKFAADNRMAWGVWQDDAANVYVAVFSDQVVKKISPDGTLSIVHQSSNNRTPLHGVFDKQHQLWVLETSDKNEVRVVLANAASATLKQEKNPYSYILLIAVFGLFILLSGYLFFRTKKKRLINFRKESEKFT